MPSLCLKPFRCFLLFIIIIFFFSCENRKDKSQILVDECIAAHGGKSYEKINISFDFRNKKYIIEKDGGKYIYQRIATDTLGKEIKDIFTNDGLERFKSGIKIQIPDSMAKKYKNSINSVVYFALLPQPLNDQAVNKSYLGETIIGGQKYHKIKVTFNQENGGKDHEDEYIYWINQQTKLMEYFAYSYKVDGGGIRFRESIKSQKIGGIRFQDYINYAPTDTTYSLENLDKAFIEGKLREFSRIENLNMKAFQVKN